MQNRNRLSKYDFKIWTQKEGKISTLHGICCSFLSSKVSYLPSYLPTYLPTYLYLPTLIIIDCGCFVNFHQEHLRFRRTSNSSLWQDYTKRGRFRSMLQDDSNASWDAQKWIWQLKPNFLFFSIFVHFHN